MLFVCLITAIMLAPMVSAVTVTAPYDYEDDFDGGTADKDTGDISADSDGVDAAWGYVGVDGPSVGYGEYEISFSGHLDAYIHGGWMQFSCVEIFVEARKVSDYSLIAQTSVFYQYRWWTNDYIDISFSLDGADSTGIVDIGNYYGAVYFAIKFRAASAGISGVHLDSGCDSPAEFSVDSIYWSSV
jgi:hypothetical protein